MIKYYCNEDLFLLEVKQTESHCDILLIELSHHWIRLPPSSSDPTLHPHRGKKQNKKKRAVKQPTVLKTIINYERVSLSSPTFLRLLHPSVNKYQLLLYSSIFSLSLRIFYHYNYYYYFNVLLTKILKCL